MDKDNYLSKVAKKLGLDPKDISILSRPNSIVYKYTHNNQTFALKVSLIDTLETEVFFIKTLNANFIPSQLLVAYDFSKEIIPCSFIITRWINGDSFIGHINDEISFKGGIEYGKELVKMHEIKTGGYGVPLDPLGKKWSSKNWNRALISFISKNIKKETPLKIFDKETINSISRMTYFNSKLSINEPKLIHGDLPNCLAQKKPEVKLLALIDPGGIVGGDPMYDLSFIYNYDENGYFGEGFMNGLLKGYTDQKKLSPSEIYRFKCLRLFHLYWKTCFFYDKKWNHNFLMSETNEYLKVLTQS